jgi:hypothetical protein
LDEEQESCTDQLIYNLLPAQREQVEKRITKEQVRLDILCDGFA